MGVERDLRAAVAMTTGGPAPACSTLPASPGPVRRHRGPPSGTGAPTPLRRLSPVEGILTVTVPGRGR